MLQCTTRSNHEFRCATSEPANQSGPECNKARLALQRDVATVAAPAEGIEECLGLRRQLLAVVVLSALALAPPELGPLERGALHTLKGPVVHLAETLFDFTGSPQQEHPPPPTTDESVE